MNVMAWEEMVDAVSEAVLYATHDSIFAREERLAADEEWVWDEVGRGFSERVTSTTVENLTWELDLEGINCMTECRARSLSEGSERIRGLSLEYLTIMEVMSFDCSLVYTIVDVCGKETSLVIAISSCYNLPNLQKFRP